MVQRTDAEGNPIFKNDGKPSITTKNTKRPDQSNSLPKQSNSMLAVVDLSIIGFDRKRSFIDKEYEEGKQYKGFSQC